MFGKKFSSGFLLLFVSIVLFFVAAYTIPQIWGEIADSNGLDVKYFRSHPLQLRLYSAILPLLYCVVFSYISRRREIVKQSEYGIIQTQAPLGDRIMGVLLGQDLKYEFIVFLIFFAPLSFLLFTGKNELDTAEKLLFAVLILVLGCVIFVLLDSLIWLLASRPVKSK